MMCVVAPSALPGLAAAAADMDALLRDIHAAVRPRTPPAAVHMPQPMLTAEFLALPRPFNDAADFDLGAVLCGIRSIRVPIAGFAPPVPVDSDAVDTPTTPVASLPAPLSYGDDDTASVEDATAATTQNNDPLKKQLLQQDPGETYDADIDATIWVMEKDPSKRTSALYLWRVQSRGITMADRAHLVSWMYNFSGYYNLAPGTLHRAVSYVDRFLSTTTVNGFNELLLVGAVAVFTAANYEERRATVALTADAIGHVGCTWHDVVDAERVLFAALGCRLGGPTAYDFIEHFTRHEGGGGSMATVRLVAYQYHLADVALLNYRSIRFLPSAVAASAIALTEMTVNPAAASWISDDMVVVTGYTLEDLAKCMAEIEEMREL
ncbi:unnamed protein product [Urochloa decumbens]|uniref:Cyclin N-terminal domain-containing protein n=1 Tax=Urochloa decumbens TaxID=240449 RepID=A0ABC8ZWI4_9POAL